MSDDLPQKKAKYTISDEERERRRQRAKEMHKRINPATGKPVLGGNQGGGRPKKKRATEIWNEKIEKHSEEVWAALYKAMRSNKEMVSLQAVKQIVEIANKETDIMFKEEKNLENKSQEELIGGILEQFLRLQEAGKLPDDFLDGDIAEAEVVGPAELEAGPTEATSEGPSGTGDTDAKSGTSPFARRSPRR